MKSIILLVLSIYSISSNADVYYRAYEDIKRGFNPDLTCQESTNGISCVSTASIEKDKLLKEKALLEIELLKQQLNNNLIKSKMGTK
jgi:hypothetical protein